MHPRLQHLHAGSFPMKVSTGAALHADARQQAYKPPPLPGLQSLPYQFQQQHITRTHTPSSICLATPRC